jgi:recombination protein RecT
MSEENSLSVVAKAIQSDAFKGQLQQLLPPDVPMERFVRTTLNAVQMNPAVLEADRQSLYFAIQKAAQWNLMPDGRHGALVVYNTKAGKKVQFMVMVEGAVKLLARAGYACHSASVYEGEEFSTWHDDEGTHVRHVPKSFGGRGNRLGAYAVARNKYGEIHVATMDMEEIDRIKTSSRSRGQDGKLIGPWADWPEQMEQKSVIHRLRKRLNLEGDVEALTAPDEPADAEQPTVEVVPEPQPAKPQPKALTALKAMAAKESDDELYGPVEDLDL